MSILTLIMMFGVLFAALCRRNYRTHTYPERAEYGRPDYAARTVEESRKKLYRNDVVVLLLVLVIILLVTGPA